MIAIRPIHQRNISTSSSERAGTGARFGAWLKDWFRCDQESLSASAHAISTFYGIPSTYVPPEDPYGG